MWMITRKHVWINIEALNDVTFFQGCFNFFLASSQSRSRSPKPNQGLSWHETGFQTLWRLAYLWFVPTLMVCPLSKDSSYKPKTRTKITTRNYWKLPSTSLVAFCSSLLQCSAFILLSKVTWEFENASGGKPADYVYLPFLLDLDSSCDRLQSSTIPSKLSVPYMSSSSQKEI